MPFAPGIGVGDFLLVAKLASKAIKELKETGEAAPKYQNLLIELEALSRALSCINTIQPQAQELVHLEAIRATASACKRPLEDFLLKLQKYDKSLGSWDAKEKRFRGVGRRVQFNLALEEDVKELRATLTNHASTINMLLLTQVLSSVSVGDREQSNRGRDLTKDVTSLRKMVEEINARHASQLRDQEKPAESISNRPNATDLAPSTEREQSTSLTKEASLQPDVDHGSQGKTFDVNPNASDLPEPKVPTNLPSATAVLDIGSRVLGIGLSISALLSMHKSSLKPKQNMVNPLYRAPLAPDAAPVGSNRAASSSRQSLSRVSNISHNSNQLRPSTADSDVQGKISDTEDADRDDDTSKASLKRKRPGPEDDSEMGTSQQPGPMHERSGGGIPIKARLARPLFSVASSGAAKGANVGAVTSRPSGSVPANIQRKKAQERRRSERIEGRSTIKSL